MWFDIPPQRTADAERNSTQTVSHAPQSEANALHRRAAEQLPPRSRRQSDPSALNVSQQSADSLRPYALRTRTTAGAARTASAARAPHAASQQRAESAKHSKEHKAPRPTSGNNKHTVLRAHHGEPDDDWD